MPYLNFNSASSALKLVISLLSIITIGLIVWFIGFLFFRLFFGIEIPEANTILHGDTSMFSTAQIRYNMAVSTIGFFILPGIFLQWLFSTPEKSYFEIQKKANPVSRLLLLLTLLAAIPLIAYVYSYNKGMELPSFMKSLEGALTQLEQSAQVLTNAVLTTGSFAGFLINVLIIAAIPAVGEELIFRGVFQKIFSNLAQNKQMGVVLAAILFSVVHGQFYGFIPRFLLGLFFGYLMLWSKTIWLPIAAHFINNLIAVTLYYLYGSGLIALSPDSLYTKFLGAPFVLVSLVLTGVGVWLIYKNEKQRALD